MKEFALQLLAEVEPLRKWCYSRHPNVMDDDLISEVITIALEKRTDYNPEYKLSSWLTGIAKHILQNRYRHNWIVKVEPREEHAICYQQQMHDVEIINRCIQSLSRQERQFIEYQQDGLKVRDIVKLTGLKNDKGYVKHFGWLSRHHLKNKLLKVGIL